MLGAKRRLNLNDRVVVTTHSDVPFKSKPFGSGCRAAVENICLGEPSRGEASKTSLKIPSPRLLNLLVNMERRGYHTQLVRWSMPGGNTTQIRILYMYFFRIYITELL